MTRTELAARLREAISDDIENGRAITKAIQALKAIGVELHVSGSDSLDLPVVIRLAINGEELLPESYQYRLDTECKSIALGDFLFSWQKCGTQDAYRSRVTIYGRPVHRQRLELQVYLAQGHWCWGMVVNQGDFVELGRSSTQEGATSAAERYWEWFLCGELGLDDQQDGDKS